MPRWLALAGRIAFAGALPFLLIEVGLRIAGWSPPQDAYSIDFDGHQPIFELDGNQWKATKDRARYFRSEPFPAQRNAQSLLLFAIGDSITWGYRGNEFKGPLKAYSDVLQDLLREKIPGGDHHVVNVGARTFASERVLGVAREVVEHEPTAVIAYFGSSEFLEHRLARHAPGWLMRSRLVQGLIGLLRHTTSAGGLSLQGLRDRDDALRTKFVTPDSMVTDASRRALLDSTTQHVNGLVDACRARGTRLVLATIPSHQRFPPFGTRFKDPSREQAGMELLRETGRLIAAGEGAKARDLLIPAVKASPEAAGLHYRLGQAQDLLGDTAGARESYLASRDTDAFPLRATSAFNELIRKTARDNPGVILVDFEKLFADRVPDGIPDERLFLDDSHPTEATHRWMAEQLYSALASAGWLKPSLSK